MPGFEILLQCLGPDVVARHHPYSDGHVRGESGPAPEAGPTHESRNVGYERVRRCGAVARDGGGESCGEQLIPGDEHVYADPVGGESE